jgi:hypothetical protein
MGAVGGTSTGPPAPLDYLPPPPLISSPPQTLGRECDDIDIVKVCLAGERDSDHDVLDISKKITRQSSGIVTVDIADDLDMSAMDTVGGTSAGPPAPLDYLPPPPLTSSPSQTLGRECDDIDIVKVCLTSDNTPTTTSSIFPRKPKKITRAQNLAFPDPILVLSGTPKRAF